MASAVHGWTAATRREVSVSERYVWKKSFAVGIPEVDEEHRAFLDLLNGLAEATDRMDRKRLPGAIADLRTYAEIHFAHEERILEAAACPGLARQRAEHAFYVRRLRELAEGHDVHALLDFARSWAIDHILGSDRECAEWIRSPSGERRERSG